MSLSSIIGDACHVLLAINTVVYAVVVFLDHPVVDPLWNQQGFCILNPDHPFFTSHDLCLYFDLVLTGVLTTVVVLLNEEPGMQAATRILAPKLGHVLERGMTHGIIAASLRRGLGTHRIVSVYIPCFCYLVYTAYTVIMTRRKGFEYAFFALIVELPMAAIGWLECIYCSQWVIRLGGHLIYNAYIPLSMLLFYMLCWVKATATIPTGDKLKFS